MVKPWPKIENTTMQYVIASTTLRSAPVGSDSASATEMPPRKPPQVSTQPDPLGNLKAPCSTLTGRPTVNARAAKVTTIATSAARRMLREKVT